jgi:3-phosphoshikimate 1-carboxyvinyltransferase
VYKVPSGGRVYGTLRVPPSKSVSNRFLNLALLARAPAVVEHLLIAEDIELFLGALRGCGFEVEQRETSVTLVPPASLPAASHIDCGHSGTMFRFLVASLTTLPGEWTVDGSPGLRNRPVGPLVEALRRLGARVEYLERDGYAPLRITGATLAGGETRLAAGESSQYLSALLMAATRAQREVFVEVESLTSSPYVDLTLEALPRFGADIERSPEGHYRIQPAALKGGRFVVEGDYSAAAYPAAAALLTGGEVRLEGLDRHSAQGDRQFMALLERMGAQIGWRRDLVQVAAGDLTSVQADLAAMPDQVPTLAALAPFARGTTRIFNVPHLRIKESDRLRAMAVELAKLGVQVQEEPDGLVIEGCWHRQEPPRDEMPVDSHNDHRIAMSLALVGLRRPGVLVKSPEVVAKSYPGFWRDLETLLLE